MTKLAVIRIRGNTGIQKSISDTLNMLNLPNQHNCIIIEDSPVNMGMIKKVQHFVTFGPVSEENINLIEARKKHARKFAQLQPPVKGFEKKGIKHSYNVGGALGNRGDNINDLIKRMTQ